jgi:uncharacterized membrane protein YedE/YeeE
MIGSTQSVIMATIGGALIGLAASLLLMSLGRVAGISGILGELLNPSEASKQWRVLFLFGLFFAGSLGAAFMPEQIQIPKDHTLVALVAAGLLVGFGTRLSNGCTSGHGICGLSRFSRRSLVAVLTFMASGFITATTIQLLKGGQI